MRSMARAMGIAVSDSLSSSKDDNVSLLGDLLGLIFKVSGEASERADVRSTHYLPSEAWVGAIDLEPGSYTVEISFINKWGQSLGTISQSVEVAGSRSLSLVEAFLPR